MDKHTRWYNDHNEKDDDANDDTNSHLHVFPPHLFPDPVRTFPETLRLSLQVVGLVLKGVEVFTTFVRRFDVLLHLRLRSIHVLLEIDISFIQVSFWVGQP